jgi:glucose/arabinose dehydrogenase
MIRWQWEDGDHTVTSGTPCIHDGIYFDTPITVSDQVFEFIVPDGVAQIPYFCRPHCDVGMTGTINVQLGAIDFMITLDGFQENPPINTPATGSGTATFDPDTRELSWHIEFQGLLAPENLAHFHGPAGPCANASPVINLPLGSPKMGSQILTVPQAAELVAGLWYVNVHSTMHTGGEIRGLVAPLPLEDPFPEPLATGEIHIRLEALATGLTAPNWGAAPPGDTNRLFVTDQDGMMWVFPVIGGPHTAGQPGTLFLDVSSRLVSLGINGPDSFDERGFLGFAFHPDYMQNGKLYTYTSEPTSGTADFSTMPMGTSANHQSVILEWTVPNPGDPNSVVDPNSARELMRIDKPQFNHNAGGVVFGPDGMLYISLGDGGGRDDRDDGMALGVPIVGHGCGGNGQNTATILGSIIRIDPDGSNSANGEYGIPASNPFVGAAGLDEIYAYGFRNPFRFSFDSLTGELYAGDVGQNHIEEIDIVVSGGNYGWRHKEGSFPFIFNGNQPGYVTNHAIQLPAGLIDPIAEYDHDEGIAVVGGFVYRGLRIPPLEGKYVFGEFAQTFSNDGRLFYLDDGNVIREFPLVGQDELGLSVLGMGEDNRGEIYAMVNGTGTPFGSTGSVQRIRTLPGDGDADSDVDLTNYATFFDCLSGPNGSVPNNCVHMDLDEKGNVSLADFAEFQNAFGM